MHDLPPVGAIAPDFTLESTSGASVTLSSLRGRNVLLAFFPSAFSEVCTAEMCAFTDDFDRFAAGQTVVLPISVDGIDALRAFRDSRSMKVDFLTDGLREVSRRYGVLMEPLLRANRAYVLIDREGIIRWACAEVHPGTRRENAELLDRIDELA